MKSQLAKWQTGFLSFWLLLFLLHLFLRVASLYTPFWDVDEAQFAGFAHVLMDGGLPFRDSLDTKSLGIYLYYAACFFLLGKFNMLGVHAVSILWAFATAGALYGLFKTCGRESQGRLSAVAYVIFSATYVPKFIATSINSVMVLFLVLSVLFILFSERTQKIRWDGLAGLVLGLAFLFKYQAGIHGVVYFLFTLPIWGFRRYSGDFYFSSWRIWFIRNAVFGVCFVLPFMMQCLVLRYFGVWQDFYEWSVLGSGRYIATGQQTVSFWWSVLTRLVPYILVTVPLWYGVGKMLRQKVWQATEGLAFLLFLSLVFALVPVCLGGRFYPHYFLQMLPWLIGLSACGLYHPLLSRGRLRTLIMGFGILVTGVFWLLRADYQGYLKATGDDDLYLQRRVGEKIHSFSDPNDRIFVWGFANVIHFYSGLKPASRFLWSDWLTGRVPGPTSGRLEGGVSETLVSGVAWKKLFEDFVKHPPGVFVDTSSKGIHGYGSFPLSQYPELYEYVLKNFPQKILVEGVTVYLRGHNP